MPFDRDVTIDFNADISGYSQSMGQMIQQTSQYTAAADGMIGKIGKLNNVIMAGVKSVSAFTQTNKIATAQAAAYQQQLSKIETSAKITGKSFKELEKTTKGLAKDFPIGMKQAVEQVEALQEAGVTSNKEIGQLAKTFTKLGAATGTFGPEVGKNMLQLNRTFENGTENMEKYADSLTTVTHMYGANAGAVTSFAKSIAPVAATVGMSETSVIGLSTAFSRLGEDGYAAANTFNKVMLDMSKSIREGTPEAKIYAEVMGTTAEDLKKSWESNPGEGFIDFVESIKAQGDGGIRSLEQLGLEGVRTQKTIMALANSGNMREIVEKAQSSYGGGSTAEAAETAMGGVNDQMTMLNETMAQTTATAGKPFLGLLESILKVANALSKALSSIVESDVIQGLAKVIGVVGGAAAVAKFATGAAMGGSLIEKFLIRPTREFVGGRREGLSTGQEGAARRAGASSLAFFPGGGGPTGGPGLLSRAASGTRGLANMAGNLGALYFRSNASLMLDAMGKEGLSTAQGRSLKEASAAMGAIAGNKDIPWSKRRELLAIEMDSATKKMKDLATMPGGLGRMAKDYGKELQAAGSYWKRAGGAGIKGLSAAGQGMAGMVGLGGLGAGAAAGLGAAGLVAGAGYLYVKGEKKIQEAEERGGKDAYRMFNDFAEKAGIATKGLVSFAEAVNESTAAIASESKTREEAYAFTAEERLQTMNPSYEAAYESRGKSFWDKLTNTGGPDVEKEALRVRGILGANASPEAINRMQMDIASVHGETFATNVTDQLKKWEVEGLSAAELEGKFENAEDKSRVLGVFGGEESAEFAEMKEAERARRQKRDIDIMGGEAVAAKEFAGAEKGLEEVQRLKTVRGDTAEENAAAYNEFIDSLNLSAEDKKKMTVAGRQGKLDLTGDVATALRSAGLDDRATQYEQGKLELPGGATSYKDLTPQQISDMGKSQAEELAEKSTDRFKDVEIEAGTLASELAGTNKIVRESGQTFDEWQESGQKGATELQKAYANVQASPGSQDAQYKLASLAAEEAIAQAKAQGGGTIEAQQILSAAQTTATGAEAEALKQAQGMLVQQQGITDAGMSTLERTQATIEQGLKAKEMLMGPEAEGLTADQRAQKEAEVAGGLAAQQQQEQQIRAFQVQQRRQQEDYYKQRGRMERNFEQQQAYAAEDYAKQRKYMIQDYHRSVERAEEDFYTQRKRAQRDFDKQITRQSEETAKNMFDPYQRIAPQMVTDIAVLQQSLVEQNQSIQDQLSSVGKLGKMGLSKDAIDQLKLMEPGQNQQVQRLLADAQQDPQSIQNLNRLISKRMKLGGELATSEYNKPFQNMKEDFETSMKDMGDDFDKNMKRGHQDFKRGLRRNGEAFATAQARAAQQHQQALDDMAEDNATAQQRAMEDLTGMAEEYTDKYVDVQKKFLEDLASMPGDLAPSTKKAIKTVLEAEIDAIDEANKKAGSAGKTAGANEGGGLGGAGAYQPVDGTGSTGGTGALQWTGGVGSPGAHFGARGPMWSWRGGMHNGTDIRAPGGTPVLATKDGEVVASTFGGWAGNYVKVKVPGAVLTFAHLSSRAVKVGDRVHDNTILGRVGSTGNSSGNHLHVSAQPAKGGDFINPMPYLAKGGVVTKHTVANIGEAGHEAVIPLNDRGMRFMSDSMAKAARYWNPTAAAGTRSQGYSAPVTNNVYTYDQRTQFMGEVKVESQDPEEMARKLATRQRRNRLARKQGSAA